MGLAGACPGWLPADLAAVVPGGGRALFVARLPCLGFTFLPPIPPAPARRALFPGGEGGVFLFSYARGFAPCIPAFEPEAALVQGANHVPGGGLPGWLPADLAAVVPGGGRALFVARLPCLWFTFLPPIPLPPFPTGRGRFFVFLCKGLRPLHPRGLNPGGTGSTLRNRFCLVSPENAGCSQ